MDAEKILNIIRKSKGEVEIISILEKIQEENSYLPEDALRLVAQETGDTLSRIYTGSPHSTRPSA